MDNGFNVMNQIFSATQRVTGDSLGVDNADMFNGLPLRELKQRINGLMTLPRSTSAAGIVKLNGQAGRTEAKLFLLQQAARARLKTIKAAASMHKTYIDFGIEAMRVDQDLATNDARMQIAGLQHGIGMGSMTESTNLYREAMNGADMVIDAE